jgi:predicted transcriptional regulator
MKSRTKKRRQPKNRDIQMLGFEADSNLRNRIDAVARKDDRSRSWVIRQLLVRALAQQEKTA